jgi:hypothetical protein
MTLTPRNGKSPPRREATLRLTAHFLTGLHTTALLAEKLAKSLDGHACDEPDEFGLRCTLCVLDEDVQGFLWMFPTLLCGAEDIPDVDARAAERRAVAIVRRLVAQQKPTKRRRRQETRSNGRAPLPR